MRKTITWLVWMCAACVALTTACSPYEFEDPTGARVTILREQDPQEGDATPADASPSTQENASSPTPGSQK